MVWLSDPAWRELIAGQPDAVSGQLEYWQARDLPVVVRRRDVDAADNMVCIGIALSPTDNDKPRLSAQVNVTQVTRHERAQTLAAVLAAAPRRWQASLKSLAQEATQRSCQLHVVGSLAFQTLTQETYVRPGSDIDLLFYPQSTAQVDAGLLLLQRYAHEVHKLPLDGEIIFPRGQAVAWKEFLHCQSQSAADSANSAGKIKASNRVLVKDAHRVWLATPAELLATFDEVPDQISDQDRDAVYVQCACQCACQLDAVVVL